MATAADSVDANAVPTSNDKKTNSNVCGICETNSAKYKCPRCYMPYCSVACNKIHRENHPPDPEPHPAKAPVDSSIQHTETDPSSIDPSNPFSALDASSDKLKRLFDKYPELPNQLLEIHYATLPPSEDSAIPASLMKGLPKKDGWNADIGIKNGKDALRKAKRAGGERGEAIREYCELIAYLMNEGDDANTAFQRQAAIQDSQLIESLLAEEKR